MASNELITLRPSVAFYGVQLSETPHRHWTDNINETSELTFKWDQIDAQVWNSLQDLMIGVGQAYQNMSKPEVKQMAHAMRETHRMQVKDPVFALEGQSIEKVGFIADKSNNGSEIVLSVKWLGEEAFGEIDKPIFDPNAEIQRLSSYQLGLIEQQFSTQMEIVYELLPVAPTIEMESRAESARIIEENLVFEENETPKEDQGGMITVFYGTNRIPDSIEDGKQQYNNDDDDKLHFGTCDVHLPEGHVVGEVERPGWFFPENEHIHVVIKDVTPLIKDDFILDFKRRLCERPKQHALVFIHGYHTTFEKAARRTAQLAWDVPFAGYTGFFSWPSAGKLVPYVGDDRQARGSVKMFQEFIKTLLEIEEIEQLHFIAHSMGSLLLTLTVKELTYDPTCIGKLEKIFQLILGAPDIDKKDFKDNILPAFSGVGAQRTMYASDRDLALEWSGVLRSFKDRVGFVGQDIFVEQGIDTVEASNLKDVSRHGYIFESQDCLNDLFMLLTQGTPPAKRRLRQIRRNPLSYWLFPKSR